MAATVKLATIMRVANWKGIRIVTTGLVMLRDCDNKNEAETTRSNSHKWLYSSFFSHAIAGGSEFMRQFLLKYLSWRLLNHIAMYCSFPFLQLIV